MSLFSISGEKPHLAESAWVAPQAIVVGRAKLAERASVCFNPVIRAGNAPVAIGEGSNVQEARGTLHEAAKARTTTHDIRRHGNMVPASCAAESRAQDHPRSHNIDFPRAQQPHVSRWAASGVARPAVDHAKRPSSSPSFASSSSTLAYPE